MCDYSNGQGRTLRCSICVSDQTKAATASRSNVCNRPGLPKAHSRSAASSWILALLFKTAASRRRRKLRPRLPSASTADYILCRVLIETSVFGLYKPYIKCVAVVYGNPCFLGLLAIQKKPYANQRTTDFLEPCERRRERTTACEIQCTIHLASYACISDHLV